VEVMSDLHDLPDSDIKIWMAATLREVMLKPGTVGIVMVGAYFYSQLERWAARSREDFGRGMDAGPMLLKRRLIMVSERDLEEPFLRAMAEAPDDDLPRMVFADWLDEHGQREWAAAIRRNKGTRHPPGRLISYSNGHRAWTAEVHHNVGPEGRGRPPRRRRLVGPKVDVV
jgi:uncharacterized protein (TIGR02996 family)